MDFQTFIQKVLQGVSDFIGEGATVSISQVEKNNGVRLQGLMIMPRGGNAAPTIYLESFFREYQEGKPIGNIILKIIQIYEENQLCGEINMDFIQDFEKIEKNIFYKIINFEKNEKLLQEIPYIRKMDLAVVFYCVCESDLLGAGSILIRNDFLKNWDITPNKLYEIAEENTKTTWGYEVKGLSQIIAELMKFSTEEGIQEEVNRMMESVEQENNMIPMYVLTSKNRCFGAVCMLYEEVLKKLAENQGNNFFILPCSIHEVILVPDRGFTDAKKLHEMVVEINHTQLPEEEILSDSVYYFDLFNEELKKVV